MYTLCAPTSDRPEGTPVLLDGVVDGHVPLELVLAVEGGGAQGAGEGRLPGVDQQVGLEVVLRLERLVALAARERSWTTQWHKAN